MGVYWEATTDVTAAADVYPIATENISLLSTEGKNASDHQPAAFLSSVGARDVFLCSGTAEQSHGITDRLFMKGFAAC